MIKKKYFKFRRIYDHIKLALFFFIQASDNSSKLKLVEYYIFSIPHRLGILKPKKKEILINLNQIKFYFLTNSSELFSYKEIFHDEIYELSQKFKLIDKKVIFDLGANIGFYSLKSSKWLPDAKIYSFEPNPGCFERLKKNVSANNLTNINTFQNAVGLYEERLTFELQENTWCSRIVDEKDFDNSKNIIEVDVINLDSFIKKQNISEIDILKIDVEGWEIEVIKGALSSLKIIKTIVIEYHSRELKYGLDSLLTDNNFIKETEIEINEMLGIVYYYNKYFYN